MQAEFTITVKVDSQEDFDKEALVKRILQEITQGRYLDEKAFGPIREIWASSEGQSDHWEAIEEEMWE